MSITTRLYIGSVGWNNKYSHVVNFASHSERSGYFASRFTLLGTTRLLDREHGTLELELEYTTLIREKYNYLWVQEVHEEHTYEWFAFITAVSRNAKNTAIVNYEVDYWQTYFFDKDGNKAVLNIKDAFIQREHQDRWAKAGVNNMTPIYSRTIEGLDIGDKVVTEQKVLRNYIIDKATGKKTNLYIEPYLVTLNINTNNPSTNYGIKVENLSYLLYLDIKEYKEGDEPYELYVSSANQQFRFYHQGTLGGNYYSPLFRGFGSGPTQQLGSLMPSLTDDRVLSIKKLPYIPTIVTYEKVTLNILEPDVNVLEFTQNLTSCDVVKVHEYTAGNETKYSYVPLVRFVSQTPISLYMFNNIVETRLTTNMSAMSKYEPKLLTQEYEMYKLSSLKNEPINIIRENINNSTILYMNSMDIFAQNDISLGNYNDNDFNYRIRHDTVNEQLLMNDTYKNYLRNNRQQIATTETVGTVGVVTGAVSIGAGIGMIATGGGLGMGIGLIGGGVAQLTNSASTVAQSLAKKDDYQNKVDQVKANVNTLGLDLATSGDAYRLTKYEIRPTYKNRVYNLFMKQGYLSNEYKVPNLTSRYYFNYIKCGYVEVDPQAIGEDAVRKIIEGIYLNGTTIWHYRNSSTFNLLDYSKENVEMSLLS